MKKHLCKVIVHCYLNEQQIRSLKQNKNINIIYGKGLKYNHDNIIIINK